jgi:hypothetical protein
MADFPKDIPALQAALLAFSLPAVPGGDEPDPWAAERGRLAEAQASGSVVPATVTILDALSPRLADLDPAGLQVLAGAAYLVSANGWFGRGQAAADALLAATAALNASA